MKKTIWAFILLLMASAIAAPAYAESEEQEKAATRSQLKTQLIQLKYTEAYKIQPLLKAFLSREGLITFAPNANKTLAVRDTPESLERILQLVSELDVKPADILITVQLVLGSDTGEAPDEAVQNDPIIRELRGLLRYKNYSLLDASLIRTTDEGSGAYLRLGKKADFELTIQPKVFKDGKTSFIQMEVRLGQFMAAAAVPGATTGEKTDARSNALISTTLRIRSGDKTVVGVSKLDGGDKGLILIVSGKVID